MVTSTTEEKRMEQLRKLITTLEWDIKNLSNELVKRQKEIQLKESKEEFAKLKALINS